MVFVQYQRCLMWQSGKVALWQANYMFTLPAIDEKKYKRLENYGFEGTKLRFDEIGRFCAENRPKSRVIIWRYRIIFVPLHCQS